MNKRDLGIIGLIATEDLTKKAKHALLRLLWENGLGSEKGLDLRFIEFLGIVGKYLGQLVLPTYRRMKMLEDDHPLTYRDFALIQSGLELEDDAFCRLQEHFLEWLDEVAPSVKTGHRVGVNTIFAVAKLFLGIPEKQVVQDEMEKELRKKAKERRTQGLSTHELHGKTGKLAQWAAEKRVQRAGQLIMRESHYPSIADAMYYPPNPQLTVGRLLRQVVG